MATRFEAVNQGHIDWVAANMRLPDRLECVRACGKHEFYALTDSIAESSFCQTLLIEDQPAAIFGAVLMRDSILGPTIGAPWALSTFVVDRYPKEFWKASRIGVEFLRKRFDILINYVDDEYEQAIRWIKRLGFQMGEPVKFGPNNALFRAYVWRK